MIAGTPGEFVRPGVGLVFNDICGDFTKDRSKFETMPASARADKQPRVGGIVVNIKIPIPCITI
jgi:hypothetical protein